MSRFKSTPAVPVAAEVTGRTTYQNKVFKEEYRGLARSIPAGQKTWMRVLPRPVGSPHNDFLRKYKSFSVENNGVTYRLLDPNSIDPSRRSIPRELATALKAIEDPAIKAKFFNYDTNKNGFKVNSTAKMFCFYVQSHPAPGPDDGTLKILDGGANDGQYGGNIGMMYKFLELCTAVDDSPSLSAEQRGMPKYPNIVNPDKGNLVGLERRGQGQMDTTYTWSVDENVEDKGLDAYFEPMTSEEADKYVDLEKVLYVPTDEEIIEHFKNYIGEELLYTLLPEERKNNAAPTIEPSTAAFQAEATPTPAPAPTAVEPAVVPTPEPTPTPTAVVPTPETNAQNPMVELEKRFGLPVADGINMANGTHLGKLEELGNSYKNSSGVERITLELYLKGIIANSTPEIQPTLEKALLGI